MLCLAAAPVLQADPASVAPVSESLRKALVNTGLELTEEHLYGQQRSEEAPPFMVLMPGLARGCHSTELMKSYLSSCRAGTSALTMVFQFGHRTAKSPNDVLDEGACVSSVQAATLGSRCNVVLAAQSFKSGQSAMRRRPVAGSRPNADHRGGARSGLGPTLVFLGVGLLHPRSQ